MFSTEHFLWLGLSAAFIVLLTVIARVFRFKLKQAGYLITGICVLSETSKILSDMVDSPGGGMHLDPQSLPFHLCSLMLFALFFITFAKESRVRGLVINFVAVMGTLGSLLALLIPTNGTDFTSISPYQGFLYHAALMWFSMFLIAAGEAKLGLRSLFEDTGILLALAFLTLYVNGAFSVYETNFFFLSRPPLEGLPYLNLNHGWYAYFLRIVLLGAVLITLFHLPFIIRERRRKGEKEKAGTEELPENDTRTHT